VIAGILKPHYLWRPRQAARRLRQVLSGAPPRKVVVELPWGLPLAVDAGEDVGGAIWRLGLYDLAVSETLWRLIEPGDVAIDAGANLGYMTSIMALRAGAGGRVLAFEPHPDVCRRLRDNVAAFQERCPSLAPIEVAASALGERAGDGFLDCGTYFAANQGTARLTDQEGALRIPVTTLDATLAALATSAAPAGMPATATPTAAEPLAAAAAETAAVKMVKIDVEGGEPQVLAGAAQALAAGAIANVIYEAHGPLRQTLCDLLRAHGYQVVALGWNLRGLVLSSPCEPPRLPPYEAPNFLATRAPAPTLARLRAPGWQVLRAPRAAWATPARAPR
jgi:FkbM family methyltransferase